MSQMLRDSAYLLIEDQLDALGQRHRLLLIVRGAMLWVLAALTITAVCAIASFFAGPGLICTLLSIGWIGALAVLAGWWIGRPLLFRPKPLHVARLVEARVEGLHNGLTNSVLLAQAQDLQTSPWLSPIFQEIADNVSTRPLNSAISFRELRPLALRGVAALVLAGAVLLVPPARSALNQGLRQMMNPAAFVPRIGTVRLIEVSPRHLTLVAGQPLEISVLAEGPQGASPGGQLIFEHAAHPSGIMAPTFTDTGRLRYSYRIDRVDRPLRWRIEVGGTQSDWCSVDIVHQVKLQELSLHVRPPAYTNVAEQKITLSSDQIDKTLLSLPEGSRVELSMLVDVPVSKALLQLSQLPPAEMSLSQDNRRSAISFIVTETTEASVLLTEGAQVIARLPETPLRFICTKDAPPQLQVKWPLQDASAAPDSELKVLSVLRDDYGIASARLLVSTSPDAPLAVVVEKQFALVESARSFDPLIDLPAAMRVHGRTIRVQIEATDNRNLQPLVNAGLGAPSSAIAAGPQTTASPIYQITLRDPQQIAQQQQEEVEKLRQLIEELIGRQKSLLAQSESWKPSTSAMGQIHAGQADLRKQMQLLADTFPFSTDNRIVQKTLLVLVANPAKDAADVSQAILTEPIESEQVRLNLSLQSHQRRIIETLEALLSRLNPATSLATQQSRPGGDLDLEKQQYKELSEDLRKFIEEEKRILDATATLVKKPVDNFDDADKKLLDELKLAQEKLDAFMQEKVSDFSKLAEQDMANASMLKELLEVYSEVTMAADALNKQAVEVAVALEENGVELAQELESNLEKWLMDEPDRLKWNQEDPLTRQDIPMAELPTELEDMVGELMEQQEDLFEEIEDTAANWAGSFDKGAGWDAMDGPIANMSAKGVTGNQLPNNNEMNGRSGEGRSGKSSGEFVEETATGKGGRNTPTRLDPTPFQQGQVNDESQDPVGGATGGGKLSGQGGAGLEGPVGPNDLQEQMQRLAQKQAELRNTAERLDLDKKLGRYGNFKLMESVAMMRRVESDLNANRYANALRRKDILLDSLETSHLLLSGRIHLQQDTSPSIGSRLEEQINDVTSGQLPKAWSTALREYYRRLSQ